MVPPLTGRVVYRLQLKSRKRQREETLVTQAWAEADDTPLVGYLFETSGANYLVSGVSSCVKEVCIAARDSLRVCIDQYTLLLVDGNGFHGVIEVTSLGLMNCSTARQGTDDYCSLSQIARLEAVDRAQKLKTTRYCFVATIVAVSPILSVDPRDPFSLLELYDTASELSCVVVLRQGALIMHTGIRVGERIYLNVKRQKWRIPEVLTGYADRVPENVFVANEGNQIHWQDAPTVLESTPCQPLVSLEGTIVAVHMLQIGSTPGIHYVELDLSSSRAILFVTYFPMDSSLLYSIRPGATVQACNVHCVGVQSFAACLRSQVVLVQHAPTATDESTALALSQTRSSCQPCAFLRIKRTYREFLLRQQVAHWFNDLRVPSDMPSVSVEDVVPMLLEGKDASKARARDAYAEFFDHGKQGDNMAAKGCPCQGEADRSIPTTLDTLYEGAIKRFEGLIATKLNLADVHVGWTGYLVRPASQIVGDADASRSEESSETVLTLCLADLSVRYGHLCGTLSNGVVSVPASCGLLGEIYPGPCLALVDVDSVRLSLICVHVNPTSNGMPSTGTRVCRLPPLSPTKSFGSRNGPCLLAERHGSVFMGAVHIVCSKIIAVNVPSQRVGSTVQANDDKWGADTVGTLQECLDPRLTSMPHRCLVAMLSRKFFNPSKARNNLYNGCMLLLSHLEPSSLRGTDKPNQCELSTLQQIEIKPSVDVSDATQAIFQRLVGNFVDSASLSTEQLTMACVWWCLASSPTTSCLTGGGWDELASLPRDLNVCSSTAGVAVYIAASVAQYDEKRGYVRFRCSIEDVFATSVEHAGGDLGPTRRIENNATIDFVGGQRFFPGMLNLRSRRVLRSNRSANDQLAFGEAFAVAKHAGIPTSSVTELHWAVCEDLRTGSKRYVAPSLVQRIRAATFLGVNYCRAQASCTKCFQALIRHRSGKKGKCVAEEDDSQLSFWNVPLPLEKNEAITGSSVAGYPSRPHGGTCRSNSPLRCPKNCGIKHATIKWECSGVLDDGTGQAKLYAERDTAVMLLRLASQEMQLIEAGAWFLESGIVFSKTAPTKKHLQEAVQLAQSRAVEQHRGRKKRLQAADVLVHMPTQARAEYLLEQCCRSSGQEVWRVDFFVRCKPTGDHLNQTEIDRVVEGRKQRVRKVDTGTYSLPPLKLNLVDCCRSDES